MGCGLILLQVDEQKRKRRNKQTSGHIVQSDALGQHTESPEAVSIIGGSMVRQGGPSAQPYDLEAWRRLVESDPDLARLSSLLAEHGQQYLDELARRYLAAADKRSLAAIVEEIVATVERDAGRRCARQEEDDPRAVMPRNTCETRAPRTRP